MTDLALLPADGAEWVDDTAPRLGAGDGPAPALAFAAVTPRGRATLSAYAVDAGATTGPHARALAAVAAAGCCPDGECAPVDATARPAPPVLLLGGPAWSGAWVAEVDGPADDGAVDALVAQAVTYAAETGARLVAAGLTSRGGGDRIERRLVELGATATATGHEDYVPLGGPVGYLESLAPAVLRRRARDLAAAVDAGVAVRPMSAAEVARHAARLAELSEASGSDGGAPAATPPPAGGGTLWWGAFAGPVPLGYCAALPAGDTLWLGARGFAAGPAGVSAGAYFALAHHAVVETAAELGFRRVELGAGAHYARVVRGCSSRPVRACTLDPEVL